MRPTTGRSKQLEQAASSKALAEFLARGGQITKVAGFVSVARKLPCRNSLKKKRGRTIVPDDRKLPITARGQTMTACEWSEQPDVDVTARTIINRLERGWDADEAVFLPVFNRKVTQKNRGWNGNGLDK